MAGQWWTVDDAAQSLVQIEQIHYPFDDWGSPTRKQDLAKRRPTLEVVVGNGDTWYAREKIECEDYALINNTLYIRPTHRPLLTIWVGAANPFKDPNA